MEKHRKKEEKEQISLGAMVSRNAIALATSLHGIGPLIQDGTFRKKVAEVEHAWHCPKDFLMMPIQMPEFSMELLTPNGEYLEEEHEVVLQLHGGGYIGKMRNAYRDFAVLYAKMKGERSVLSIDYRVAPKDPFPAALEDACAAYHWLLEKGYKGEQIVVAGDSAGGGLALSLALYLRDHKEPLPKKLVLISTIDVFTSPKGVDERSEIDTGNLQPYGYNRYQLELWVREHYPDALIVRLPGLFGKNIKKNFIYDFIHVIPFMLKKENFLHYLDLTVPVKAQLLI